MESKPFIFFDGECPFCNKTVNYILKHRSADNFYVAPLQGTTANERLSADLRALDTLIYMQNDKVYTYSSAALKAIAKIGGIHKLILVFWIVPKFIRDAVYKVIAKNRKKLISSCSLDETAGSEVILP